MPPRPFIMVHGEQIGLLNLVLSLQLGKKSFGFTIKITKPNALLSSTCPSALSVVTNWLSASSLKINKRLLLTRGSRCVLMER